MSVLPNEEQRPPLAGDAALEAALPGIARDGYAVRAGDACERLAELPEGSVHLAATSGTFGSTDSTNNPLARRFGSLVGKHGGVRTRDDGAGGKHRLSGGNVSGIPVRETLAWDPGCGPAGECDRCKGEGVIEVPKLPEVDPAQAGMQWCYCESAEASYLPCPPGKCPNVPRPVVEPEPVDVAADVLDDGMEDCPRCMGYGEIRAGCTSERPVPALVLDPFLGSGTTVREAVRLGRRGVGFDLSEEYLEKYARPSIAAVARQPGLLGLG